MDIVRKDFIELMHQRKIDASNGKKASWVFALVPNKGVSLMIGVNDEKNAQNELKDMRKAARELKSRIGCTLDKMFFPFDLTDFTGKTRYVIICCVFIDCEGVVLPQKIYSWIFPPEMSEHNRLSNDVAPNYVFFRTKNRRDAAYDYLIRQKSTK